MELDSIGLSQGNREENLTSKVKKSASGSLGKLKEPAKVGKKTNKPAKTVTKKSVEKLIETAGSGETSKAPENSSAIETSTKSTKEKVEDSKKEFTRKEMITKMARNAKKLIRANKKKRAVDNYNKSLEKLT